MPGINAEHSSHDRGVYSPMNFDSILKKKPPNNKLYGFLGSKSIIDDFFTSHPTPSKSNETQI